MKNQLKIQILILALLFSVNCLSSQTKFQVQLKVVDNTANLKSSLGSDQSRMYNNIYVWVGTKSGVAVYSGDWWYPMYNGESGRPNGLLIQTSNSLTWQVTFELAPGDYKWNPGIKSWGWKSINSSIFQYTASATDNPDMNFTVNPDGTISGITTLTITDLPTQNLTLLVDMSHQTVSSSGVFVSGNFSNWTLGTNKMTDQTGNGIYSITLKVNQSTTPYEYVYINGSSWDKAESVFGLCEFCLNRFAVVNKESVTMPVVSFGYCSEQPSEIPDKKIACIGNSITAGAGLQKAYQDSWPIQLRTLLGAGYYTENLGVSGTTMMKTGDSPWWNQHQYSAVKKLQPDVVLISLGTNDSKTYQWNASNFKKDYLALIDSLTKISSHPHFYLLTSAKAYSSIYSISDNNIYNGVIPVLKEISSERKIPLIDTYSATLNMSSNFPDGVHPNAAGAQAFATHVADILKARKPAVEIAKDNNTASYAAYQWYKNGTVLIGKNDATLLVETSGKYQVSVKLFPNTNDMLFTDEISIDLNTLNQSSVTLTVNQEVSGIHNNLVSDTKIIVTEEYLIVKNTEPIYSTDIYNINGNLVKCVNTQPTIEKEIAIADLPAGFYALLVNKTKPFKFIK